MLTKTQIEIMKVFASKITNKFSIKQVSEILRKPYPLIHRSIKDLMLNKFILKDSKELLSLNYYRNHSELAYIESLRSKGFLGKNKIIELFVNDILEGFKHDFFIFLVFGSSVEKKQFRDIDILLIVDNNQTNSMEKAAENISSNFTLKLDINVISMESAYEMLLKTYKTNVMNETLNNHIILFGAENYYRLLKNVR